MRAPSSSAPVSPVSRPVPLACLLLILPSACGPARVTAFGSPLTLVPPGTYTMGAGAGDPEDAWVDHEVTLTRGFWIMEHEVTQGEWYAWAETTEGVVWTAGEDLPVDAAGADDAMSYANALSAAEGREPCYDVEDGSFVSTFADDPYGCPGYRLPMDAEWEYAARAGQDTVYAGSDSAGVVAWTSEDSGGVAHAVCTKEPNAWGLCDMSGNVTEWTNDLVTGWEEPGDGAPVTDPTWPVDGTDRVHRGGGCADPEASARVANPSSFTPGREDCPGFRLVRTDAAR